MKILVLYYSGVGNTKMVAMKIFDILHASHEVTIRSIEKAWVEGSLSDYDALVVGFPTIHSSPAEPILTFIKNIKPCKRLIPTFLFTTCGLYSANTLRIFAKMCIEKNIVPILNQSYRCAATDGMLIAPYMDIWFHHEKELDKKVASAVCNFETLLSRPISGIIPRIKLYSVLNYPNKFFGQRFSPKIYVHKDNCVSCGKCIKECPVQSISKDESGLLIFEIEKCIHCYRCIHHCPKKALSLSKKHPPLKTLYY